MKTAIVALLAVLVALEVTSRMVAGSWTGHARCRCAPPLGHIEVAALSHVLANQIGGVDVSGTSALRIEVDAAPFVVEELSSRFPELRIVPWRSGNDPAGTVRLRIKPASVGAGDPAVSSWEIDAASFPDGYVDTASPSWNSSMTQYLVHVRTHGMQPLVVRSRIMAIAN